MIMKKLNGFTVIELMITIVIAAILMTVAIPSFLKTIQNNQITTQANELFTSLSIARAEAIKQGDSVTVCSSTDQASCAGSTDWKTGWIVFTDNDGDRTIDDDGDTTLCETGADADCLLSVRGPLKGEAVLTGTTNYITFNADGRANAATDITLKASASCGVNEQRTISVTSTGRAGVVKSDCP